jgi:gliding motility-associated lipoprotein GldH
MQTRHFRFVALAVMILLQACTPSLVDTSHSPDDGRWAVGDSLSAGFEVVDTTQAYRLRLSLSLNEDYPYRNLYVRFRLQPPTGASQVATPEFVLQDVYGNWNVARTLTGDYSLSAVLNDSAVFRQPGRWQLSLGAYTRSDTLPGVSKVRFEIAPR